jgi:hypothetical protein
MKKVYLLSSEQDGLINIFSSKKKAVEAMEKWCDFEIGNGTYDEGDEFTFKDNTAMVDGYPGSYISYNIRIVR